MPLVHWQYNHCKDSFCILNFLYMVHNLISCHFKSPCRCKQSWIKFMARHIWALKNPFRDGWKSPSLAHVFCVTHHTQMSGITLREPSHKWISYCVCKNRCAMWPSVSLLPASWATLLEINCGLSITFSIQPPPPSPPWSRSVSTINCFPPLSHYRHVILQRTLQIS